MRILGDYLKFDETDAELGVFLLKDGVETRLEYYGDVYAKRIDVKIPGSSRDKRIKAW